MQPTIDLTCCCKKDLEVNLRINLSLSFLTETFFKVLTGDLGGDCDAGESGTVGMYAAAPDITFTFE